MTETWLPTVKKLPVIYEKPQVGMSAIKGAVLHTTNHGGGAESLERFQHDWNLGQRQSAHFMVDRSGNIGQFRALEQVAWHILGPSVNFVGIEHILRAQAGEDLNQNQINASGDLLLALSSRLRFPLTPLKGPTATGVGVHQQFLRTACGTGVFWLEDHHRGRFGDRFWDIIPSQLPTGRWEVRVGGKFTWIYVFDESGTVKWRKLNVVNPMSDTGSGRWVYTDKLRITWPDIDTLEEWEHPLRHSTTGRVARQGQGKGNPELKLSEPERAIIATRMDAPL